MTYLTIGFQRHHPFSVSRQTVVLITWIAVLSLAISHKHTQASEFFSSNSPSTSFSDSDPNTFLPVEKAFVINTSSKGSSLYIDWQIAPNYYLYKHTLVATADNGLDLSNSATVSRGIQKFDGYFGQVEILYHQAQLSIDTARLQDVKSIVVNYQGCAEAGLCYPTQQATIELRADTN